MSDLATRTLLWKIRPRLLSEWVSSSSGTESGRSVSVSWSTRRVSHISPGAAKGAESWRAEYPRHTKRGIRVPRPQKSQTSAFAESFWCWNPPPNLRELTSSDSITMGANTHLIINWLVIVRETCWEVTTSLLFLIRYKLWNWSCVRGSQKSTWIVER